MQIRKLVFFSFICFQLYLFCSVYANHYDCYSWIKSLSSVPRLQITTSQFNQDAILQIIFEKIGTTNKMCVEFGFGYANSQHLDMMAFKSSNPIISGLNVHALIRKNWTATFFDAIESNPAINLRKEVLTRKSIGAAFKSANIPKTVDYVSIDVDSIDLWLLLGLLESGYRPRVISIEYNANFGPDMLITCEEKWAPWIGDAVYGTSAAAIHVVAQQFNYRIVTIMPSGTDIFLIHDSVLQEHCYNNYPSFQELVAGIIPFRSHLTASSTSVHRFVDFSLALQNEHQKAHLVAAAALLKLNSIFPYNPVVKI